MYVCIDISCDKFIKLNISQYIAGLEKYTQYNGKSTLCGKRRKFVTFPGKFYANLYSLPILGIL